MSPLSDAPRGGPDHSKTARSANGSRDATEASAGRRVSDDEQTLADFRARLMEFPAGAAARPDDPSRRDFVKLLGASMALAGLGACIREPDQEILGYVSNSPETQPGVAQHYATSMTLDGYATGVLVTSHAGRPTKIEGNPDHPASLGAAGIYEQASVLGLYDPHRARDIRAGRRRSSWGALSAAFAPSALAGRVGARGAGLRLLLEPTASPLVAATLARVRTRFPDARAYFYAPLASAASLTAAQRVLGAAVLPQHDLLRADVVVALDADCLASGPFHLRYAHDFAARRRAGASGARANRLYVAESSPSPTGTLADERLAVAPSAIARLAAALLETVAERSPSRAPLTITTRASTLLSLAERAWVSAAAADLIASAERGIVIAGRHQPADVHALVHALNAAIGAVGVTVTYAASPIIEDGQDSHDITALAADLRSGAVDTLVILEGNPAYGAPGDVGLPQLIRGVRNSLYLGAYDDETAAASTWHVPAAHYLESWGDARAYDGTESLVQPLIAPMYGGRTAAELLALVAGAEAASPRDALRELRRARHAGDAAAFDAWWSDALRRGVVEGSAASPHTTHVRWDAVSAAHASVASPSGAIEIRFTPSATVHDGRFGDNAWLQELPDPLTKLTWDNAVLMSAALAARDGIETGDVITLRSRGRSLAVAALVLPGHADGVLTLAMGYGRTGGEAVARGVGVNANVIRSSAAPFADVGVTIARAGTRHPLAITQSHWSLEGRGGSIAGIVSTASSRDTVTAPRDSASAIAPPPRKRRPLTLYEPPPPSPDGFGADQWAMTIDLDACTGCGACVIACQAENNIPVVGKEGVLMSREMHWMRIDRYFAGEPSMPLIVVQPMLCQHCEKAPCEYVCPVDATVHSDDGLNEMIYNRCVGTRFCSNNCPYKVRRFNWFDYNAEVSETERMVKNPSVTVRDRGVMEKCTFCVQRIRGAQITAELADEPRTGPVVTACQQTCPTHAIVFGSLTDPASDVVRLRDDPRAFTALDELGTVPRVRYLARTHSEEQLRALSGDDRSR